MIPPCDSKEKCWRLGRLSTFHALEHWFNFVPHPAQVKIINGLKKVTTIAAGRRFGKSTIFGALALEYALTHKNSIQFIIAPSQDQARIIFSEVEALATKSTMVSELIESKKSYPFSEINFKSGSSIHARSVGNNEGKYLRGHKAHRVYIDECAFMDNKVIHNVILPLLADYNGELFIISTPLGQHGFFYESFMKGQKGDDSNYASFQFSSFENPHISHEYVNRQRATMPDIQFRTEWLAEFTDDSVNVFRGDCLIDAQQEFDESLSYKKGHQYYMGVDIAKMHDYTAISIIDGTDPNEVKLVYTERFNNRPYSYVVERIISLANSFSVLKIHIDETGVGAGITEQVMAISPMCEGFTFSQQSKVALINTLKTGLEQRRIKISKNNETLLNELRYYQYSLNQESGTIRMNAPSGMHDDMCFIAGTLVTTPSGQIPIEKLKVGDYVMTRKGPKKIIGAGNRLAEVINKFGLTGTEEHPVFTSNGLKKLRYLKETDIIYVWNQQSSLTMEKIIGDIRNQNDGTYEFISGITEKTINAQCLYTDKFGLINSERSKKDMLYITKTEIHSIILSIILKFFHVLSICHYIKPQKSENLLVKEQKKYMNQKYVPFLKNIGGKAKDYENREDQILFFSKKVEKNYKTDGLKVKLLKSMENVCIHISEMLHYMKDSVNIVIKNILPNVSKKQNIVLKNAERMTISKRILEEITIKKLVYNLSVEDEPEYFANFILVHNCISFALAYQKCAVNYAEASTELILQKSPEPLDLNKTDNSIILLNGSSNSQDSGFLTVI